MLPVTTATPSAISPTTEPSPASISQDTDPRCRLCHRKNVTANSPNIYEESVDFIGKELIVNVCVNMLGIKYARHEYLPERICGRCLDLLEDFYAHRQFMQERENNLQEELKNAIKLDAKYRPGLNGNPGEFQAEDDCVIVDIDPDQLCESSDEEFNASEGEDEEYEDDTEEGHADVSMDASQMQTLMEAHHTMDRNAAINHDVHPKSAFLCQYCDLAFTLQRDCQAHEQSRHDPVMPYTCNYCQLRLGTRPALIGHIKNMHDAERPYVCAHCNKGFCRRSDLKKHTIVHTGVRPYTCHVCSKSFSRNTNLTKHMRIHSGVKPFVCQQCPRSFQTQQELWRHKHTHSEIKQFQCHRCPASFARRDKLQAHQQMHERRDIEQQQLQALNQAQAGNIGMAPEQMAMPLHPYLVPEQHLQGQTMPPKQQQQPRTSSKPTRNFCCDVCSKSFQRERDLHRHRALHMDTLFACKVCGQGFQRREKLQRHEIEVHGPSYSCNLCFISFSQQSELETHLQVHKLQDSVAKSTQAALNANVVDQKKASAMQATATPEASIRPPSAAELSFYSNLIPTMNLGFYSETRPDERTGI